MSDLRELEQKARECKPLKVRAKGKVTEWVGTYDLHRRRGGDVFDLKAIIRKRKTGEGAAAVYKDVLITPEEQFSESWMERVQENIPNTKPAAAKDLGIGSERAKAKIETEAEEKAPKNNNEVL